MESSYHHLGPVVLATLVTRLVSYNHLGPVVLATLVIRLASYNHLGSVVGEVDENMVVGPGLQGLPRAHIRLFATQNL